jgi:hypothetical protein
MTQLTLFPPTRRRARATLPHAPFVRTSETSTNAAATIAPLSGELRKRVLHFIADRGQTGATDQEICAGLQMLADTSRARRVELRNLGLIADSQNRRPSPSGRASTIWVTTAAGQRADISREIPEPDERLAPWERDDLREAVP